MTEEALPPSMPSSSNSISKRSEDTPRGVEENSPQVSKIRKALTPLLFLALSAYVLASPGSRSIGLSILVLLTMVALHEAGHLIAARLCGVDAPEYSVGFGPKIFSLAPKSGKTIYSLRAIPLGGYVRIRGLGAPSKLEGTDDPSREVAGKSYEDVSRPKRIFIAFAGPLANVLTAVLILFVVFSAAGEHTPTMRVTPVDGSPAALAGVRPDDRITEINGNKIQVWEEVEGYVREASASSSSLVLTLQDESGATREVSMKPRILNGTPKIGVAPVTTRRDVSAVEALSDASATTWDITRQTAGSFTSVFRAFASVPSQLVSPSTPAPATERVISPIGAASLAEESARRDGWAGPATMAAAISVFLALFNLLPLPPLDGSHILITTYEGVASRLRRREVKVSVAWTRRVASVVTLMVLFLGVSALLLDILQPVSMP